MASTDRVVFAEVIDTHEGDGQSEQSRDPQTYQALMLAGLDLSYGRTEAQL